MLLDEYQLATREFAKYPSLIPCNPIYPSCGVAGEVGEFQGVIADLLETQGINTGSSGVNEAREKVDDRLLKEGGDVLWYLSATLWDISVGERPASELVPGTKLSAIAPLLAAPDFDTFTMLHITANRKYQAWTQNPLQHALRMGQQMSIISENVKKAMRDDGGVFKSERVIACIGAVHSIMVHLGVIGEYRNKTLEMMATANIAKLKDRKSRNVLSGSGDNR